MATQLFFTTTVSEITTGNSDARLSGVTTSGWAPRSLSLSRGASATTATSTSVAGPTNGVEAGGTSPLVWYSSPLDADVTISGSVTWNLWANESNMSAEAAVNGLLEVIDGATGTITLIDKTARTTEVAVTTSTANNFSETPASGVACKRGDRLRVQVFFDDVTTMASGYILTFNYNGTTAAVAGDSYFTLTENLTFVSEPAGSQVFLTDTASDVSTASVDREAWTSRGAGVQTDVLDSVLGPAAPLQWTDTAGGTVVDWFTKPLTAFTLGGAVRCNIRLTRSSTFSAGPRVEVARVAGDGTSPTIWAASTQAGTLNSGSEVAKSFLVSGANLAISDGQRLRLRVYLDDSLGIMASGATVTLHYAGTSGGASGDTYLTFTQTLTEYVSSTPPHPFNRDIRLVQQLAH